MSRAQDEEVLAPAPASPATVGRIAVTQVDYSGAGTWLSGQAACAVYIGQALDAAGITDGAARSRWTAGMLTIAERESAYNAPQWQVNDTDLNAVGAIQADGHKFQCSRGGWQVIPPTFAGNHQAGTSLKIYDPVANCAAAINYIMAVYGVARDGRDLAAKVQQADPSRVPRGY